MDARHYRELEISRRRPIAEAVQYDDHKREVTRGNGRVVPDHALPESA